MYIYIYIYVYIYTHIRMSDQHIPMPPISNTYYSNIPICSNVLSCYIIWVAIKNCQNTHRQIHPRNLTWNPKMKVWKVFFLFTRVILRFHISFPGGNKFIFGFAATLFSITPLGETSSKTQIQSLPNDVFLENSGQSHGAN